MSDFVKDAESKMQKTIEAVKADFASVRAGRANASVLDRVQVEYYGSPTPLNQVASISSPDPRQLVIQPWDSSLLREIEKAILTSELGINLKQGYNGDLTSRQAGYFGGYMTKRLIEQAERSMSGKA